MQTKTDSQACTNFFVEIQPICYKDTAKKRYDKINEIESK